MALRGQDRHDHRAQCGRVRLDKQPKEQHAGKADQQRPARLPEYQHADDYAESANHNDVRAADCQDMRGAAEAKGLIDLPADRPAMSRHIGR